MSELDQLIHSWGVGVTPAHTIESSSPDAWLAAAEGRPEWQLWGKGRPSGDCPAHPLLCHVVDVAAVAALLITRLLPSALRQRLLAVHPAGQAESLGLLLLVIALHDLGKVSPAFQAKVDWARSLLPMRGFDLQAPPRARHHGNLGLRFVIDALNDLGAEPTSARFLARAVTAHHGEFPNNDNLAPVSPKERGAAPRWDAARRGVVTELATFFGVTDIPPLTFDHAYVALLAGLTAVADWIGSMDDVFTYVPPQPSLAAYWSVALQHAGLALEHVGFRGPTRRAPRSFGALFPTLSPWPLHVAADALAATLDEPSLVVIEAPMGEGKTEAALLLADASSTRLGQHGLYIGLPTRATANQMLGRVHTFLERAHPDERSTLILAHGEADLVARFQQIAAVYDVNDRLARGVRAEGWFRSKKRTLLAEYGVGTIDQALLGVMRTGHAFVRLYALAGKTVVFDEVHAYDTYTSTLLDRLVEWLAAIGSTVLLLSATLPSARRAALVAAYRRGLGAPPVEAPPAAAYPRLTIASHRRYSATPFKPRGRSVPVALQRHVDDPAAVARLLLDAVADGGCAGWICNTVARAQQACELIRQLDPALDRLLLHSRLLPEERARREQRLESWLGPEREGVHRPHRCIVIGTQVLEQSLDVDFDLLVIDLAPVDLLLQRAGRLHRHQRGNRSPRHPHPRLVIVQPDGPLETVNLDRVAKVYAEALLRRSLRALGERPTITLPDDIEALVEEVYREGIPSPDDALLPSMIALLGAHCADRQNADGRLLPRPTHEDDPFGDLKVTCDDDEDPRLHKQLRAETRLGPTSVDLVCLVERDGSLYVDESDPTPLALDAPPDHALTRRLVRRTLSVNRESLVRDLLANASYQPESWPLNALLRYRRAVAFRGGVAVVGDTRLTLDPELGLLIDRV